MAESNYSTRHVCRSKLDFSAFAVITAFVAIVALRPEAARAAQASIALSTASTMAVHHDDTQWSLDNTGAAQWTVTVTKTAVSGATIDVDGFVALTNVGKGGAVLDNIVVNLQTQCMGGWASVAADIADIAHGAHATFANIAAAASSEEPALNQQCRAVPDYQLTPLAGQTVQEGTFFTSSASGRLLVKAKGNSVFSQRPRFRIEPTQSVRLFYTATFDNGVLGIPAGTVVRAETIVTFNNAGGRGGSGALAFGIDTDGDEGPATGAIGSDPSADDEWARSIPVRRRALLGTPIHTNGRVTLADPVGRLKIVAGRASLSDFATQIGGGTGREIIAGAALGVGDQAARVSSVTLVPGAHGATLDNCASLNGKPRTAALQIIDPATGLPMTRLFRVGSAVALAACNLTSVMGNVPRFAPGDFCTFTQAEWGEAAAGANAGSILANHFAAEYPNGVDAGINGGACAAGSFDNKFVSAARVMDYLPRAGGAAPLTACQTNATDDTSGALGGEALALAFNVDFNSGGFLVGADGTSFGDLMVCGTGTGFDGKSVAHALRVANRVLAGGAPPAGANVASVAALAAGLNTAFDACGTPTSWAELHLAKGACP